MIRAVIYLLITVSLIASFGCGRRESVVIELYCSETFWYVMQEEARAFYSIYGMRVVMIPIRAERTDEKLEPVAEEEPMPDISTDTSTDLSRRTPAPWRSLPKNITAPPPPEKPDAPQPVIRENPVNRINPAKQQQNVQFNADILKQITFLNEGSSGDLYLTDSARQITKIRELALSVHEYPFCYLTLNLLVHNGNPHQFDSVRSVFKQNRRIGIVDPLKDGLGETASEMLAKTTAIDPNIPAELILQFDRQYDLLEALELGKIDAALVWNASNLSTYLLTKYAAEYNARYRELLDEAEKSQDIEKIRNVLKAVNAELLDEKSFAEYVPLPASDDPDQTNERRVISIPLISLSSAAEYGYGQRFADFLRSSRGREILERFGFTVK
ncbi:hypothetical protein FACS1894189_6990 [Planctomycetales bacterium]|nr:hypothetical protein FACS1894189_6990 [Planctomycetales bacterium]